jgi:deazaflavin-dependent oxidoreductase (nitroreductase family)
VAALALGALVIASRGERRMAFRDALKRANRRWFNPLVLRFAGHAPWPVARIEHRGRSTGAFRATPVLAWPVAGGFVVAMPYGTDVDWAKNLLHAGEGVLQYQGVRYRVGNPRIVPVHEVRGDVPGPIASLVATSGVRHVARLEVLPGLTPEISLPA